MKPFENLQAVFTVPNLHQQLSAARPVQVYTYAFCSRNHARASTGNTPSDDCGTLHVLRGARTLIPHNHEHHEIALVTAGFSTLPAENCCRVRAVHRIMELYDADGENRYCFNGVIEKWEICESPEPPYFFPPFFFLPLAALAKIQTS